MNKLSFVGVLHEGLPYFYGSILQAIDELLKYKANPSLRLTHGNGNALCVASHTAYEHRRSPDGRIDLVR